ncbi:FAD-dependent oxidoreductase [Herbiconiux daphne]|uniref:FAD-dependent monooxygenase n=1 Tax=Herbiconiux daphne TaxID=2970914 RepID=A0ABT2H1M5_9MICO|nr:NAD(P)/FAD-dependent oxidoreductase [Herbiconiux daphne]MCS5733817.1 FAD-dependent monooxygenase [Herbiconiux daphne]
MKALIIGGGIAGTATALALHQAGIDCEVHEARESHSDGVGAFITVAVNGVSMLDLLGVDIRSLPGVDTPFMQLALGDGEPLTRFPLGPVLDDGTVTRTITRSELYAALRRAVEQRGIPIQYGHRLERVDQAGQAGPVTAHFAGGDTATGDLLIGADGLHSRVRSLIDAGAPKARYLGVLNAGGYATGVAVDAEPGTMQMIFGRSTFFSYLPAPDGTIWWFANPPMRDEPARGSLAAIDGEAWRTTLLDLVAADDTPAAAIIQASPELFAPWATHDFPSVPVWHRAGMIIIGDAAHAASPSSGQGASMALEDAVVLALALRDSATIEQAFDAYESLRRRRVARVVARGKRAGSGKAPGPVGRVVRDAFLRTMFARSRRALREEGSTPPRPGSARSSQTPAWLFDYRIDWQSGLGSVPR